MKDASNRTTKNWSTILSIYYFRTVRALASKPRSQSGHLDFNEGDKLKVILEVDDKWLLCERGARKGLVPRNCVNPIST